MTDVSHYCGRINQGEKKTHNTNFRHARTMKTAFTYHFGLYSVCRLLFSTGAECTYLILKGKTGK